MYSLKDISVIIATYNRSEDLFKTVNSFKKKIVTLEEVLIIDQSTDNLARKAIKKLKSKKIRYYHSKIPSLTAARNKGIDKLSDKGKIVIFLDDDVTLDENYFENILAVFNKYPEAKGVSGHYFPKNDKINSFELFLRRVCLLESWTKNKAEILSPFGATYPHSLTDIICASWIPGFNMAYKKELFNKEVFDENFSRYALAEDLEFSTRINKKYPNSLFITPYASIIHRVSKIERTPKPKLIYMNLINHLYIQSKNFNTFKGIVSLGFALISLSLLNIIRGIAKPNIYNLYKTKIYLKSILFCFGRLYFIRNGNLEIPKMPNRYTF